MTTFKVVSVHIFTDCLPCFSDIVILGQICFLVLEAPEPSFNHDIVSPASFTIHAIIQYCYRMIMQPKEGFSPLPSYINQFIIKSLDFCLDN